MDLKLLIKNGTRKGEILSLSSSANHMQNMQWLKEDEIIEFQLLAPEKYTSAVLELYEHKIEFTHRDLNDIPDHVKFTWKPMESSFGQKETCIFINYFGVAELNVALTEGELLPVIERFEPIEVLASKINATRVGQMFDFLAQMPGEVLHSVFRTTRHSLGFDEGARSPDFTLERLEHICSILQHTLPAIIHRPITRLTPEQLIIPANGSEDLDDSSIGWLLENASLLCETDNLNDSHFEYNSKLYRSSAIQLAVLKENSDLYENQVIHGFISLLLSEAQNLFIQYSFESRNERVSKINTPLGYVSFFEKIAKFKNALIGGVSSRCDRLIDSLNRIKLELDTKLPVRLKIIDSPIITPKVKVRQDYRIVFNEILKWHEKGKPDWSAYENLFAIQSIPKLFEAYCYFKVIKALNNIFRPEEQESLATQFIDRRGTEIWLRREPVYWMKGHNKAADELFVNSEAWTVDQSKNIKPRSNSGSNSHRSPDIVIEIFYPDGECSMLVFDSKYSTEKTSFTTYLPQLTMKYAHGIHRLGVGKSAVNALTIFYPSENGRILDFNCPPFDIFGETPAVPSLACFGILIGKSNSVDDMSSLINRLLLVNSIYTDELAMTC